MKISRKIYIGYTVFLLVGFILTNYVDIFIPFNDYFVFLLIVSILVVSGWGCIKGATAWEIVD